MTSQSKATVTRRGRWVLDSAQEGLRSLHFDPEGSLGSEHGLGNDDVLVDMKAASLNYKDLVLTRGKTQVGPMRIVATPSITPASDGAGVVLAVGTSVAAMRPDLVPGVRVTTHMIANPKIPDDSLLAFDQVSEVLGQTNHGALTRTGVFHHKALLPLPDHFSFAEAATLGCSALTAWNALMGVKGKTVKKDDWVLVMGSGGVSVAALQIAVAAGANVVATTGSDTKAPRLRELGASRVLNYRTMPGWGVEARGLTPSSRGFDHVIEVGGPGTLQQSLAAVCIDGVVSLVGGLQGFADTSDTPNASSAFFKVCIIRGVLLGSRDMFRDMMAWMAEKGIRPALDDVQFSLEQAVEAYERVDKGEHFSKVVININ